MDVPDDLSDFLSRARDRLLAEPPDGAMEADFTPRHGDHAFSPGLQEQFPAVPGKPAAVLVPIIERQDGPSLLLTQRSGRLRNHSGQIAFPGGRIDPGDAGPLDAALREAEEEIGLSRESIRPVGYSDLYLTTSGYRICPVVALVDAGHELRLNPDEVEDTFECPLSFVMDPANHRRETREWHGAMRSYYAI